jgi:hypothetical protein
MVLSSRIRLTRRVAFASLLLASACGPQATKTDKPARSGAGGSPAVDRSGGAGGGSAAGGSGGSTGSGGTASGAGGTTSSAGTGGTGAAPMGDAVPLPASVTASFPNQGWFADDVLVKSFGAGSTVIKMADASTGPCAARQAPMRGRCLKIVYTPPAGVSAPDGGAGYVGVFFLTTVLKDHSGGTPPAKIGDPNWGDYPDEAGVNIAPGATKITFHAASETEGQSVSFKAGVAKDNFVVAEQAEVLGTAWKAYSLPLASAYAPQVLGGFAWVLTNTAKPATFYLDNIVWE